MPEISEVHLNTDLVLRKEILRRTVVDINILSGKYLKKKPLNFNKFKEDLPALVTYIGNRGKFVWIKFNNGWYIGLGFGMTGRFSINPETKHHRIELILDNGQTVYYTDPRNFGNWNFWNDKQNLDKKLSELGVDILLEHDLTKEEVVSLFRQKNDWEITKSLMSQKILAGVGNYLKAEGLYEAKIYPYAKVSDLTDTRLYILYKSLVRWAKYAYIVQAKNANAIHEGSYQDFRSKMNIYSKDTDPLGNTITRSTNTKDGRTTHWVKEVQTIGK